MTIDEARAARGRWNLEQRLFDLRNVAKGPIAIESIELPLKYSGSRIAAAAQLARNFGDLLQRDDLELYHRFHEAGRLLCYALKLALFDLESATNLLWLGQVANALRHGRDGPTYAEMFIQAVRLAGIKQGDLKVSETGLTRGCKFFSEQILASKKTLVESHDRNEKADRDDFLSPAQCIRRLPLEGMTVRQKRHQLDKLRKRFFWIRSKRGWLHADDFDAVVKALNRSSVDKNVSVAIAAIDPSPETIRKLAAEIKSTHLSRKARRR